MAVVDAVFAVVVAVFNVVVPVLAVVLDTEVEFACVAPRFAVLAVFTVDVPANGNSKF